MDRQPDSVHEKPICILLSWDIALIFNNENRYNNFRDKILTLRNSVMNKNGIELPVIHLFSDYRLPKRQYQFFLFGKKVETSEILETSYADEMSSMLYERLESIVKENIQVIDEHIKEEQLDILSLQCEQSRESCQRLYLYYLNMEKDAKKAFHWLKRMCWYGVPSDIRKLADCYANGTGCEVDSEQARKLNESLSGIY